MFTPYFLLVADAALEPNFFAPVLVAEDEETDVFLLQRAFKMSGISHKLVVVRDGQEAVDYLSGKGAYSERVRYPLPSLILLDLKMPRMTGFDVLAWLATQPLLKKIPALVLSSSADESDMEKARQMGARDYFAKPHHFQDLVKLVQELHSRWLEHQPETISRPAD